MKTVTVSLVHDLADIAPGWHVVNLCVGPFGDPLVQLSAARAIDGPVSAQPLAAFRCIRFTADGCETLDLPEMLPLWKLVQPLPRRRWLVVCPFEFNELAPGPPPRRPEKHLARLEAQRATRASAPNARVYDDYGVLLSEFWAGENIGYLQTTADGRIWCGWGDEGIFSDNVSSAGVGCLDEWGRVVFDFHAWLNGPTPFVPQLDLDTYLIAHCEALNVDNATGVTIAYWGTPTTLVRLFPDRHVQTWLNLPVDQPQAVVIDDQWALFSSINDTLVLVELDSVATTPLHVVDAEGNRLQIAHPVGRGSRLWFMADMRVYEITIEMAVAGALL